MPTHQHNAQEEEHKALWRGKREGSEQVGALGSFTLKLQAMLLEVPFALIIKRTECYVVNTDIEILKA